MITISTTHQPATDLGFLLHKNPERIHRAELTFGSVTAFYPEAAEERATIALLLDVDPVKLVRGGGSAGGSLAQYVNDRPFVASSFLSVAIAEMFGTAMSGRSKERPELAETPIELEIRLPVVRCKAGEEAFRSLFEPLGYEVELRRIPLDDQFPEWGDSMLYDLTLRGKALLSHSLRHIYVLLPVLDASKHYYMEQSEVDKLLTKGEGWLNPHPKKDWIVRSYLGRRPSLMRAALEQLANIEPEFQEEEASEDEAIVSPIPEEKQVRLHDLRHDRVVELIREIRPKTVLDLGCGDGKLVRKLVPVAGIDRIVGMDVSYYELERAERRLKLENATPRLKERVQFLHGSLTYRDNRLQGFDLAAVVEVVEHLDPSRLAAFERVVFEHAKPRTVLLTTPNREYNEVYGIEDRLRHQDHRFEWSRAEFYSWCRQVGDQYGYRVRMEGIGEEHPDFGCPSLMGVFER